MRPLFAWLAAVLVLGAVEVRAQDLTANRTLRAGTIIASGDLALRGETDAELLSDLVGLELRRAVYAGRAVARSDLGPPTLVRRNDIVTILYRAGGLSLRTEGRALGAGGAGERIEVMNLDTRLTVRAVVTSVGLVEVGR